MNEELANHVSILEATLDSVSDAILVVDRAAHVVRFNERFAAMWRVPPGFGPGSSSDELVGHMATLVVDAGAYRAWIRDMRARPDEPGRGELHLNDGRILERTTRPMRIDGEPVGRV